MVKWTPLLLLRDCSMALSVEERVKNCLEKAECGTLRLILKIS